MIAARFVPVLLALAVFWRADATAGNFAPHRAAYTLNLLEARPGSGVSSLVGEFGVQWEADCEGWTFQQRAVTDILYEESDQVRMVTRASSWESADGHRYSFSLHTVTDGSTVEHVEGVARTDLEGEAGGRVRFTVPAERRLSLPAGTVFPVAHTEIVLDAARKLNGTETVSGVVFDGTGNDKPQRFNGVIARAGEAAAPPDAAALLEGRAAYSVALAYFPLDRPQAEPDMEMALRMYDNGVADRVTIDYGDFRIRARLARLEMLEHPDCGG